MVKIKFIFDDGDGFTKEFVLSDNDLRNMKIQSMWEGLEYSKHKYEKKLQILSKRFNLSPERIRNILSELKHSDSH